MAILLMDGMDCYADTTEFQEAGWQRNSNNSAFSTTAGKNGGGAISMGSGGSELTWRRAFAYENGYSTEDSPSETFILQAWVKSTNISVGGNKIWARFLSGIDEIADLELFTDGSMEVTYWNNTTPVATGKSATGLFVVDTWYFLEFSITLASTTSATDGSFDFKLDGTTIWSGSSLPLAFNTSTVHRPDSILLGSAGMSNMIWDDVIIMDGTGSDINTSSMTGARYIDTMNVASDGGTVDWTRNTGTNDWEMVDDTANANDGDTTYVSSNTVAEEGRYNLETPSNTDDDVHAVQIKARLRKDDAGARTVRAVMNVAAGTEEVTFDEIGPTTEYQWYSMGVRETNDTGGTAWDASELTNIEIGVEIVS